MKRIIYLAVFALISANAVAQEVEPVQEQNRKRVENRVQNQEALQAGEAIQNEKDAKILKEKIVAKYPKAKVTIRPSHGLCAFYAEVGSLMVGFAD